MEERVADQQYIAGLGRKRSGFLWQRWNKIGRSRLQAAVGRRNTHLSHRGTIEHDTPSHLTCIPPSRTGSFQLDALAHSGVNPAFGQRQSAPLFPQTLHSCAGHRGR